MEKTGTSVPDPGQPCSFNHRAWTGPRERCSNDIVIGPSVVGAEAQHCAVRVKLRTNPHKVSTTACPPMTLRRIVLVYATINQSPHGEPVEPRGRASGGWRATRPSFDRLRMSATLRWMDNGQSLPLIPAPQTSAILLSPTRIDGRRCSDRWPG